MSLLGNILSGAAGAEVGRFQTSDTQSPTDLGAAGVIRVHYGVGGTTLDNAITVDPDGLIHQNLGRPYDINFAISMGRADPAGVAKIMGRIMVAPDGIEANAVQAGSTVAVEVDNANTIWIERVSLKTQFNAGTLFWLEIGRDEDGNDAGDLLTNMPTGTLSGWNPSSSASVIIRTL